VRRRGFLGNHYPPLKPPHHLLRKLERGRCSNTFLVEDLQPKCVREYYTELSLDHRHLSIWQLRSLTVRSTSALQGGFIHEPNFLQAVAKRASGSPEPLLPILHDHFAQRGPHGVHYCFLTSPLRSHVHAFHASAPTGKLAVHIIKPIITCVVESLKVLHSLNIIHAGRCNNTPNHFVYTYLHIKADNVLFLGPNTAEIEEMIAKEPPLIDGSFKFQSGQYPILRSQPFHPRISWDASPFVAETIQVVLSGLGAGMQTLIPSGGINICNAFVGR